MVKKHIRLSTRRGFLASAGAALAAPAVAQYIPGDPLRPAPEAEPAVRRNVSGFRALEWQPYFSNTKNGAILVDTVSRHCTIGRTTSRSTNFTPRRCL